jgi:hypothetical protein
MGQLITAQEMYLVEKLGDPPLSINRLLADDIFDTDLLQCVTLSIESLYLIARYGKWRSIHLGLGIGYRQQESPCRRPRETC